MALISGILIILIGVVHIIYGEVVQLKALTDSITDMITIGSTRIMIYQGGVLLLLVGTMQVLKGLKKLKVKGFLKYIPVGYIVTNFSTYLVLGLLLHPQVIKSSIPQIIIFVIIIVFLFLDLLIEKRKQANG